MKTDDRVALDDWYAVETAAAVTASPSVTRLLGQDIACDRLPDGTPRVRERLTDGFGPPLPVRERYGCLWTTLGHPNRDVVAIVEAEETDRRFVPCGWVKMRTSGPRVVENFLDMAHFPFVHTDILGAEPHTEVPAYASEIRRDVDEVWATNCSFFQPRIAATATAGDFVRLTYRVPSPFVVMLYRVCPSAPHRLDAIALFIQPMDEALCRAQPVMYLVDPVSTHAALLSFEQVIFLQDRIIVENQRPLRLPWNPATRSRPGPTSPRSSTGAGSRRRAFASARWGGADDPNGRPRCPRASTLFTRPVRPFPTTVAGLVVPVTIGLLLFRPVGSVQVRPVPWSLPNSEP